MKITLILNKSAGTLRTLDAAQAGDQLSTIFRDAGHEVRVMVLDGGEALDAVREACRSGEVDAVVVGGGDGTISASAGLAASCGITLGILPLGTMNLFARALSIPLEMKAAATALAGATPVNVDIAEVNGHAFVHHMTLGLHARMIRARERSASYGSRLGKMWASAQAAWMVVRQPPRIEARLRIDGRAFRRRTAAILISNNPLGEGHLLPYANDPRHGRLGVYVLKSRTPADILKMALRLLLGRIASNPHLDHWEAKDVEITLDTPTVSASVDGEIVALQAPLRCVLKVGGLSVLKPEAA